MKEKSKRLQPVVDFTQQQEVEAAKALSKASEEVMLQKKRLEEFENYRNEYGQQFSHVGGGGMTAAKARDYQSFFNKLNHVLEQQKVAIQNAEVEFELKKRQWLAARNKLKAINKVKEKHVQAEEIAEEKQLQKEQDDRNIRKLSH